MTSIWQMEDDDREMALMEMANDRAQSAREGSWYNSQDAMTDAAGDLAAMEREDEHRMNCNDPDCLGRDEREAEITREYEAIQDRIDAALIADYPRWLRLRNIGRISRGTYRVELPNRPGTAVNLKVAPNPRDPRGFKFAIAEDGGGLGRVTGFGGVYLWDVVNPRDEAVRRALEAIEVLLSGEDPTRFGKAYSRATASCYRCGEALVDEEKNPYYPDLGPVCGKKVSRGER